MSIVIGLDEVVSLEVLVAKHMHAEIGHGGSRRV
jgi:hypothetical protein